MMMIFCLRFSATDSSLQSQLYRRRVGTKRRSMSTIQWIEFMVSRTEYYMAKSDRTLVDDNCISYTFADSYQILSLLVLFFRKHNELCLNSLFLSERLHWTISTERTNGRRRSSIDCGTRRNDQLSIVHFERLIKCYCDITQRF